MSKVNVIVELAHTKKLESNAVAGMDPQAVNVGLDITAGQKLAFIDYDNSFPPVMLPSVGTTSFPDDELYDRNAMVAFDAEPANSTYLVRGTMEESDVAKVDKEVAKNSSVVNVFADVGLDTQIICPGSPPLGTDADVERLLCTSALRCSRMDGNGVLVAIVDTGVNMAYLNSKGKTPTFDAARSWAWNPAVVTPGSAPVDHGTMCAFDVCISAPRCTLLDIALLHPISAPPGGSLMSGLLSDAIRAYRHLLNVMLAPRRPGELRSLVVNNSWGMFHPSWDFPVGHSGNYSDNPNHPFNLIVATLERAGADILFAAGNCGKDCPDGRCQGVTTKAIYGANSSPYVTCVAGVDTTKKRVGYSAIGPGRLAVRKPDVSGYTHFKGSGVYGADGGTSAACPVVSGVVAAVRTRRPFDPTNAVTRPAAIRSLITSTAQDLGPTGYDFEHGYGVINGCALARKFPPRAIDICRCHPRLCDICRRFPWICRPPYLDFCRRFPHLCEGVRRPIIPIPPIPPIPPVPPPPPIGGVDDISAGLAEFDEFGFADDVGDTEIADTGGSDAELAFMLGTFFAQQSAAPPEASTSDKGGCGCKDK